MGSGGRKGGFDNKGGSCTVQLKCLRVRCPVGCGVGARSPGRDRSKGDGH